MADVIDLYILYTYNIIQKYLVRSLKKTWDGSSISIKKNPGRNKYIFKFNFYIWDGTRMHQFKRV